MIFLYYLVLFANIGICLRLLDSDLSEYSPSAIFWLFLLTALLIPSISDPFIGDIQAHAYSVGYKLDIDTLLESHTFVFLFLSLFSIAKLARPRKHQPLLATHFVAQKNSRDSTGLFWLIAFLLASLYGVIEAYLSYGNAILSNFGFTLRRETQSFASVFLSSYNLVICAGIIFWLHHQKRTRLEILAIAIYLLLYLVMGGSRQHLMLIAIPFLLNLISSSKFRLIYAIAIIASFEVTSRSLEFLLYLRNLPGLESRIEELPKFLNYVFSSKEQLGSNEASLRFSFYYFVRSGAEFDGFGEFNYLIRTLFFWLPSFLDPIGIKPIDFEYTMFSEYMPGQIGTLHPTFFGSLYADSKWMIIPWVIFFTAIYNTTKIILRKYTGVCFFSMWGLYAYLYMMMARGSIYGPLVGFVFGIIFINIIKNIPPHSKQRTISQ